MKLFWKVFFSTMFTALFAFSAGAFFLIDSQFRTSLSQETAAAKEENSLLRQAVEREFAAVRESLSLKGVPPAEYGKGGKLYAACLRQAARTAETGFSGSAAFRLLGEDGTAVYGTLSCGSDGLAAQLSPTLSAYELILEKASSHIHTAGPVSLEGETYYLESSRDISALFSGRDGQYRTYSFLALGMAAACALVSLLLSRWLTEPVRRLSAAARKVACGDLSQRVPAKSRDELGTLSLDFNAMTGQLETQVDELRNEARRREEFVASFAHELKTPLTSIIGYADLLRSKRLGGEEAFSAAHTIFQEGKRLEALSMKLLDLIVLEKRDFSLRPVSIDVLFDTLERELRPVLQEAGIHFSVSAEPADLLLEPDLMQTACLNLLDNARKAVDPGGHIRLFGRAIPGGYAISVRDDGKGIPPEELSKITEPFYMVEKSRARSQGGAGLGLALCREIAALHGGELRFHSEPSKGTLACILLKGGTPV